MISCVECHRPPIVIVENVPEFASWILYRAWCSAFEALGYKLAPHMIDAADLGVPQHRRRIFIVATRSVQPIALHLPTIERVPFAKYIDHDASGWRPVSTCRPGVRTRVAKGRRNFPRGLFLSQHVTGHPGRSIDRPIGTITTKRHWALVREGRRGDEIRMLSTVELQRAMGFEDSYSLTGRAAIDCVLLGNAVVPKVAEHLVGATALAA